MPKRKIKVIKGWAVLYSWGEIANLPNSFTSTKKTVWKAITCNKNVKKVMENDAKKSGLLGKIVRCEIRLLDK